jgi:hypothetical protein
VFETHGVDIIQTAAASVSGTLKQFKSTQNAITQYKTSNTLSKSRCQNLNNKIKKSSIMTIQLAK